MFDSYKGRGMAGTRDDLSAFLKQHRRALVLRRSDVWNEGRTRTFVSLLDTRVFLSDQGKPTRIMDWQIMPF